MLNPKKIFFSLLVIFGFSNISFAAAFDASKDIAYGTYGGHIAYLEDIEKQRKEKKKATRSGGRDDKKTNPGDNKAAAAKKAAAEQEKNKK
jgi:hypothetical protein